MKKNNSQVLCCNIITYKFSERTLYIRKIYTNLIKEKIRSGRSIEASATSLCGQSLQPRRSLITRHFLSFELSIGELGKFMRRGVPH